jgi:hypothetical protein
MLYYNYPISLKKNSYSYVFDSLNIFNSSTSTQFFGDAKHEQNPVEDENKIYYDWRVNNNLNFLNINLENSNYVINPNLIYNNFAKNERNIKYKINNLYVIKKTHYFPVSFDYQGELILEHSSITNDSGKKIYVIILLQETNTNLNKDDYLKNIFNINTLIHKVKSKTNNNIWWFSNFSPSSVFFNDYDIFVFPSSIFVETGFFNKFSTSEDSLLEQKLHFFIKMNYKNYEVVQIKEINNMQEGFQEGYGENDVKDLINNKGLTCEPIDENGNKINNDIVVVPLIGSEKNPVGQFFSFLTYFYFIGCICGILYGNYNKKIFFKFFGFGGIFVLINIIIMFIAAVYGGVSNNNTAITFSIVSAIIIVIYFIFFFLNLFNFNNTPVHTIN